MYPTDNVPLGCLIKQLPIRKPMESASRIAEFWSTSNVAVPCLAGARAALGVDWGVVDTPRRRLPVLLVPVDSDLRQALADSEEASVEVSAAAAAGSVEAVLAEVTEADTAAVIVDTEAGLASVINLTAGVVRRLRRERQQDPVVVAGPEAMVVATVAAIAMVQAVAAVMAATGTATETAGPAAAIVSL